MNLRGCDAVSGRSRADLILQALLIAGSCMALVSFQTSWVAIVASCLFGAGLVLLRLAPLTCWSPVWPLRWPMRSCFSLLAWLGVPLASVLWDLELGAVVALCAALAAAAGFRRINFVRPLFLRALLFMWLAYMNGRWLWTGYLENNQGQFCGAYVSILALLFLSRLWFCLPTSVVPLVNTVVLLMVGLPLASLAYRPHPQAYLRPDDYRNYYSFEKAKGDPAAFARAEEYFFHCLNRLADDIAETNSQPPPYLKLRPNSHGYFGQCLITINSQGFRGREIPADKGDAYRIVALGESTTFGMTIEAGDRPWPELLEEMVHQRLKTRRQVEVINAGVFGYTLWDNLRRFSRQILPLKPDMIISYHGANGFHMIDRNLLRPLGVSPPDFEARPIRLAADFEHRIKLMLFRRRELKAPLHSPYLDKPLETRYAEAYRQLIKCAATNNARLVLAEYSMAVNQSSEPAVIDFYQGGNHFGDSVRGRIKANGVHSEIVQQLARQHPEVGLIDTHPRLDGEHQKFMDLVHFTQEGRKQLAENIFAGIKETLENELGR
jgi:lysophospholipase L1-like esterase